MFDLIIRNGTVATAADVFEADIGIIDGRIAQIGRDLGPARREIDAAGKYVLPGGIDSHVHISQPSGAGITMADDFESGTRSALFGGNTTVMPFCLPEKGAPLREALADYHALAEGNCYTDVSFHIILNDPTPQLFGQDLPALIAKGYTSVKVFMTYDDLKISDGDILRTLDTARAHGGTVQVHCENEDAIKYLIERAEREGNITPFFHTQVRPIAAEREATHRALTLAEVSESPIVIVHVSNAEAIGEISASRARGVKVIGETCPQYLLLTAEDLRDMDWEGAKLVCSPPPRDKASQEACWRGIENGIFDLFSSDHCPFRYNDVSGKQAPKAKTSFRHIPNGIPGVELRMPILFSEGVLKGRIDLPRFVALTATNHARAFGLYPRKGTIAIGSDADITIWDPEAEYTVTHADLHDNADYTPYEGLRLKGRPETVVLRGKVMIERGALVGDRGDGHYQPATPHPAR
ncbi:dihydropyrimidinase [Paenirhodobacter populi]|uniref:D-hydantoinase n=1 Tax=Paenirhodobacter populi TaxID=2306993 RepID=A0A443J4F7_9RHOB|nr:dihydropyrimidinase [Sinirhodobacter populi]RWR15337.1 dihydropyrimidinase [Sinirhodobacter populi]